MDKRHIFEDPKSPNTTSHHHNNKSPYPTPDPNNNTALSTQDWLDTLSRAKEIAISQSLMTTDGSSGYSYSAGDDAFAANNLSTSALSSIHASSTLDAVAGSGLRSDSSSNLGLRGGDSQRERSERMGGGGGSVRATLTKHHSSRDRDPDRDRGGDAESVHGGGASLARKRFSKRQSKGVLAAVF